MHGEFHFWQHRFQDTGMGNFFAGFVGDAHIDVWSLHKWSQLNSIFLPAHLSVGG